MSDRVQAEKQKNRRGQRQAASSRKKCKDFYFSAHAFVLFRGAFHTDAENFFSLLVEEAELKAVYFTTTLGSS